MSLQIDQKGDTNQDVVMLPQKLPNKIVKDPGDDNDIESTKMQAPLPNKTKTISADQQMMQEHQDVKRPSMPAMQPNGDKDSIRQASNSESFFGGAKAYSSSCSSDFDSDDSFYDGCTNNNNAASSFELKDKQLPSVQFLDQQNDINDPMQRQCTIVLSESEDDRDEVAQMLMNSSTKHFSHVNCQQSKAHVAFLFEARPEGQSRLTKEQTTQLRRVGTIARIHNIGKLEKKLTREYSKVSQISAAAQAASSLNVSGMQVPLLKGGTSIMAIRPVDEIKGLSFPFSMVTKQYSSGAELGGVLNRSLSSSQRFMMKSKSQIDNNRRLSEPNQVKRTSFARKKESDLVSVGRTSQRGDTLYSIMESSNRSSKSKSLIRSTMKKHFKLHNYVWYFIMSYLDLPFILTRLMSLSTDKRMLFQSLNSALFDVFLRGYGLCVKLRRSELPGKLNLYTFLTKLEQNMVQASQAKAMADIAYQSLIDKQNLKRKIDTAQKRNSFRKAITQQFLARPSEPDDLFFEFDQSQFSVGNQLQVFPYMTDGGFQTSTRTTNTMFEIFNSKYQDRFEHLRNQNRHRGRGGAFGSSYNKNDKEFRQYISSKTKDVSVACYLGCDCAIKNYQHLSMNKIFRKEIAMALPAKASTAAAAKITSGAQASITGDSKQSSIASNGLSYSMISLRGVSHEQYLQKEEEKDTYKVLHQLEFNSYREQAQQSAKANASPQYDDYYYEEVNQSVFESNQKSIMIFLVNSQSSIHRSEQLRILDSETLPDLAAFQKLGFPLKQTIKLNRTSRQTDTATKDSKKDSPGSRTSLNMSQDPSKLYSFQTLPLMESAIGNDKAQDLLDSIVADEELDQNSNDYGCICEIDLSQRKKISKIISQLLYPPKQASNTGTKAANATQKSSQQQHQNIASDEEEKKAPSLSMEDTQSPRQNMFTNNLQLSDVISNLGGVTNTDERVEESKSAKNSEVAIDGQMTANIEQTTKTRDGADEQQEEANDDKDNGEDTEKEQETPVTAQAKINTEIEGQNTQNKTQQTLNKIEEQASVLDFVNVVAADSHYQNKEDTIMASAAAGSPTVVTQKHQQQVSATSQSQQLQSKEEEGGVSTTKVGGAPKSVPYLEVMPLLYIKNHSKGQVLERWALRFQQKVGAKYLIVKTLNSLGATENQHSNKTKDGLHHGQFILYGEKMPAEF